MKLAFSTLGCPDWQWNVIVSSAKDIGMDGIEVRCIANELYAPKCREFAEANAAKTVGRLAQLGMSIPVLDSNASIAVAEKSEAAMKEARDYIDLASRIGTPYVRVMCVPVPQPVEADLDLCTKQYAELCCYGEDKGVMPLLETNGPLGDSALIRKFMDNIPSENKGVLWDIHHPYRYFNEAPEVTFANLGGYMKHLHIKDSVVDDDGKIIYRMLGKGTIPVKQTILMLRDSGYEGFVSLEWVKKWNPELESAGIVFPNFANWVRRVLASTK